MSNTRIKKPVMSRKQRDLQVAVAGRKAVEAAGRMGADPAVLTTMARANSNKGVLPPPALNVMVALDGWWECPLRKSEKVSPILDMAANVFCFQKPDEAIEAMQEGVEAFLKLARAHSATVPLSEMTALTAEIAAHVKSLFPGGAAQDADEAEPGKPRKKGG